MRNGTNWLKAAVLAAGFLPIAASAAPAEQDFDSLIQPVDVVEWGSVTRVRGFLYYLTFNCRLCNPDDSDYK
jgi:hypothetical protein